jgi:hypothetical protein
MKQIGTCDECANWAPPNNAWDLFAGECAMEQQRYTGDGDEKTPEDGIGYWDGEAYIAGWSCGPKFGCIHWEPKSDAPDGPR